MQNNWFRWERAATIHLLFPTLEVFYQPLFRYSGVSAPTMVLVFKNGVVTWCIEEDEFIDYGERLLSIYSNPIKPFLLTILWEQLALPFPKKISYVSEADNYLLKHQDIQGFIKRYFWYYHAMCKVPGFLQGKTNSSIFTVPDQLLLLAIDPDSIRVDKGLSELYI